MVSERVRAIFRGRRLWFVGVAAIAAASLLMAATGRRSAAGVNAGEPRILPVPIMEIREAESVTSNRFYTGTVSARRSSDLGFERGANIVSISVDEGDPVRAGQPLAALDTRGLELVKKQVFAQLAEAQARLEELEAGPRREAINAADARWREFRQRRRLAELQRERRLELLARQAVSKEEFESVEFQVQTLAAAEEAARHELDELLAGTRPERIVSQQAVVDQLAARLEAIQLDIDKSVLRSPFRGRVSRRFVDEGTVIAAGDPVLAVVEVDNPEVRAGIPVDLSRELSPGDRLPVEVNGTLYNAESLSILPELNSKTRSATLVLRLPPEAASSVIPGEVARLHLRQELNLDGYWLPTTALTKGIRGLWACYALETLEDGTKEAYRLARRDVEIMHTEKHRVLVRGTVQPGDIIVESGVNRVSPGQLVRPSER